MTKLTRQKALPVTPQPRAEPVAVSFDRVAQRISDSPNGDAEAATPKRLLTRHPALARSRRFLANPQSTLLTVAILGIWLAIVIFTATRHEFWRDEVRALSLARAAASPLDFFGLLRNDGHPLLWYLLLYVGTSIVDTPLVLPITSIAVGFAAVALFMFCSPFPFWFRCLFSFGALPLYEYSVMARNYGISMLLLFLAAMLFRKRTDHPLLLASVLALLANTNVHSAMLVCLIAVVWAWDRAADGRGSSVHGHGRSLYLPAVIVCAGVLLCAAVAMPSRNTIVTPVYNSLNVRAVAHSFSAAALRPDETFAALLPTVLPSAIGALILFGAVCGLLSRPVLLLVALGAQIGFGVFFRLAYVGSFRHQGLYLIFLVFLYWIFIDSRRARSIAGTKHVLFNMGLYAAMLTLLVANGGKALNAVWADIRMESSSSRAFGEFLKNSETYASAIIVPEPAFLLESLPYYADNAIYLPRERRFGTTVSWTTASHHRLTLGELLSSAREIKVSHGQPVLIVLGRWDLDRQTPGEKTYIFKRVFSWTADERAEFSRSTVPVTKFSGAYSDENYTVYSVR